jgi:hypothetical protein
MTKIIAIKRMVEITSITINFTCNDTVQSHTINSNELDYCLHSGESECEMCGSHGNVSIDVKCENCNKIHEITLKDW